MSKDFAALLHLKNSPVFIIYFLLLSCQIANGQSKSCESDCSCSVKGIILDAQTNEPLEFVALQIKNSAIGAVTNENGGFSFKNLCEQEFDIQVSHIGYKSITHHHDAFHEGLTVVKLAPENLILESIVIEEEIPRVYESANTKRLSGKELDEIRNQSLGDVLANISGVSTLKTGNNVSKPIIHGLHSNRVLIINNGIRHESQEWGQEHAPEIDPSLAEKLTVIKGAAAVKYGPNALGGVIVVNPPKLELSSHLHGDMTLRGETNGRAIDSDILVQKGFENFAWMVQGAARKQGDLAAPGYQLTNTGAEEYSGSVGMRYHKKNWDISLYLSHLDQKLGVLRSSITGNIEDLANAIDAKEPDFISDFSYNINTPNQQTRHTLAKIQSSYNFSNSRIEWKYGYQFNNRKEFDIRRGSNNNVPSINLDLTTHTFDLDWIHPSVNNWEGSIGIQWLYQDNNNVPGTNTIPFVPNYNNSRIGIYITESKTVSNDWVLDWGLRYDAQLASFRGRDSDNDVFINEITFNSLSAMAGVYKTLDKSTIRINLATAWRPPNIAELYSFGKHLFTNEYGFYRYNIENGIVQTDRVLTDEEATFSNEIGYKLIGDYSYKNNNLQLEVSPYINYIQNFIYKAPFGIINTVRGPFPGFIYKQSDVLLTGMDVTLKIQHSKLFSSKISGSYLWSKDIENDDVLFGITPNQASYQLNIEKSLGKLTFNGSLNTQYVFNQWDAPRVISARSFIDDPNFQPFNNDESNFDFIEAPDGYFLVGFSSRIEAKRWSLGFKATNLFNHSYREYTNLMRYFADAPGVNYQASLQIKF